MTTPAQSRAALSARARVLDDAAHGGLKGPRARRLGRKLLPAAPDSLTYADVSAAPEWIGWSTERRELLACVTGAVLGAGVLRRMIDGSALGRIAGAVGPAALDAILALPASMIRDLDDEAVRSGDVEALGRVGQGALVAELANHPALQARVARLFSQARSRGRAAGDEQATAIALGLMASGQVVGGAA